MRRPAVSVVMPFAGDEGQARAAAGALLGVDTETGDELILVDNRERAAPELPRLSERVRVLRAHGELSPAHARNAGAAAVAGDWILFLDSDCTPSPGLLAAYFAAEIGEDVGALAGEIVPRHGGDGPAGRGFGARGLASRYAEARSFLGQEAHLAHPYRPRAAAANLLVRRAAFEALGGFFEGVRAAGATASPGAARASRVPDRRRPVRSARRSAGSG